MSLSVAFEAPDVESPEQFFLCSIGAWGLFREWAKLDPTLKKFVDNGRYRNTLKLQVALDGELRDNPPRDDGVLATAEALLEMIGVGDPKETITLVSE